MRSKFLWAALMLTLIGLIPLVIVAQPSQTTAGPTTPDRPVVVRIEYETAQQLQTLAAEVDVWEVHPEAGYLLALVDPGQYADLEAAGYRLEVDAARSAVPETIPEYPCYRTIAELYADLDQVAATYPEIAELETLGTSYDGLPLKALRLTNRAIVKDKPVLLVMANIHGRELITPETAMVFVDYLTQRYGNDPDVTWLLDHHQVHVLVSTNPDGHIKNEPGEPWAWWRKNIHPYGTCLPDDIGVDLNRNHSFKWACCGGSSGYPCSELYRGPSVASEPETQALEAYVRGLFPDQRGPEDTDAAPADTTGVLITLHSYGNLLLWPWGWTSTPPPNVEGLAALGRKMATYNGYSASGGYTLYLTDGTTDDWSYGELGIASYTFEIGRNSDGFYPSCTRYDALIQPNIPALLYAAKVARTPYMTSHGPDALAVSAEPACVPVGIMVHLTAKIDDAANGAGQIAAAEYYVDVPPWDGGTPLPMLAVDGAFDEVSEEVEAAVVTGIDQPGQHILFVRGQDSEGYWGPVSAVFVETPLQGTIEGYVLEAASGLPVPTAGVGLDGVRCDYSVQVDATGYYSAPVNSGVYTVTASAFGYYPETVASVVASCGITTVQNLTLTLIPTGTVQGHVWEAGSGQPLTATIRAEDTPVSTASDDGGAYGLVLPEGGYTLTAQAPGYASGTLEGLQVVAGQVLTGTDLWLEPFDAWVFLPVVVREGGVVRGE
ncbi:MAG: carboxypeptidase regulatory-like domain-containing protein [Anaerolineae bacterium]|nr:carboxypeptidase regulatory-like domain-containing protein [Anaerolineae bacterium]